MNLSEAQKILENVSAGKADGIAPEIVKEAMKLLMDAVMESFKQEKQFPPAPPPELPCAWRQSHALQEARMRVPEPSHFDCPVVRYIIPEPMTCDFYQLGEPVDMKPIKTSEFRKKMFQENGMRYEAWTADGKTPVFPIPL